jgi:hypothetical protein
MTKDKYILVSFCNIPARTTSPLAVLQLLEKGDRQVSYAPVSLGYPDLVTTATGMTRSGGRIFVLFESREKKTCVAALQENDLTPLFQYELPEVKDGHSILATGACLYVVSTGTDEVICYDIKEKSLENPRVIWQASDTKRDTHHVNSITEHDGDILVSAFGPKTGDLWATASNGYIFNITTGMLVADGIHHPHSLSFRNGRVYYSDSHRNTFCVMGEAEPIFGLSGYSRGISWFSDKLACMATSIGRRTSRSTGMITNPADPGEPAGECTLLLGDISKKKIVKKFDLSWFGPEIYDVLALPEFQADLLALSNFSQRSERQAIQILSSELIKFNLQVSERDRQVAERDRQIAERDQQVRALSLQVSDRDRSLQEIMNSTSWKLIQRLRNWYEVIAPAGGKRDRLVHLGINALLIWRREGTRALLRRILQRTLGEKTVRTKISSRTFKSMPRLSQSLQNKARQIEASGFFDHEWYLQDNPDVRNSRINPVEHYLAVGIHNERNPNPLFNTSIYARSLGKNIPMEDALLHFADSGRIFAPGAYRNAEVLLTAQQNYLKEFNMECMGDSRSAPGRFAVLLQCGAGSIHKEWLTQNPRDWDLLVNHYDPTYLGKISCEIEFSQSGKLPGTKSTAFYKLLERWPHFLESYEYVLLLDDDIFIEEKEISRLFMIASENGLDLAQASLSPDSNCAHPIFKNSGRKGLRYVNGVEIMMPVLSRSIIQSGGYLFGQAISGWGVDSALGKLASAKGGAAVIDDVIALHTKPINVENGAFYRMLHQAFIYPEIELTNLQRIYGVGRSFYHVGK